MRRRFQETRPAHVPLADLLTRDRLRDMAGARSFAAGEQYWASGMVSDLSEFEDRVTARVRGTHRYHVELASQNGDLSYECSCPWASDTGEFCKHCVAVGLAFLRGNQGSEPAPSDRAPREPTLEDVRAWLERQEANTLVRLLLEQAMRDENLRNELLLRVARSDPNGPNLPALRKTIDRAVATGGFVEYEDAYEYAHRVEQVTATLADLLEDGHAGDALGLAEYAIEALEAHLNDIDDSNGGVGGVLARLQELHHDACVAARLDDDAQADLAARLWEWELRSDWGAFEDVARTYADALGDAGIAAYRKLAEDAWATVPARGPDDEDRYDGRRWRITQIMESLARAEGDLDRLLAVKSRDLSSPYRFLEIAQICQEAGRSDEALAWAERGRTAFPDQTDDRLSDFLAAQYARRDRHDEALTVLWEALERRPGLARYQPLKHYAEPTGRWPAWRERALGLIRDHIAAEKTRGSDRWGFRHADPSEVVRVLLWDNDVEAAWREAQTGGCTDAVWMELAERREAEHPEDALIVYRKRIEPLIEPVTNGVYDEPVRRILKVRALMRRLDRDAEFTEYVTNLRFLYKRKRNFLKLLEAHGL